MHLMVAACRAAPHAAKWAYALVFRFSRVNNFEYFPPNQW